MKETALLLSMLVVFALAASGYVFWKGLEDGRRSKYSLLLRCIQIITSVVPANLPMQTGLAGTPLSSSPYFLPILSTSYLVILSLLSLLSLSEHCFDEFIEGSYLLY